MDLLYRSKNRHQKSFEAKLSEVAALVSQQNITVNELQTGIMQLEGRWKSLDKIFVEVFNHYDAAPGHEDIANRAEEEWGERDRLYDAYIKVVVDANAIINSRSRQGSQPPQQATHSQVKLPKLELVTFDGNILKWREFWASFESSIHGRNDLADEDKFNYLRQYLTGDALKAIEGLSLTPESYAKAIDTLKEEFGKNEAIIQSRLVRLYELQESSRATDTASLRKIYSNVRTHVRELEALGYPVGSLGSFLVTLLLRKMPDDMQVSWFKDRTRSPSNYEAVLTFIMEELDARNQRDLLYVSTETTKLSLKDTKSAGKSLATATALTTTTKERVLPCLFCGSTSHKSGKCNTDLEGRKASLKKAGRCFICVKKGHLAAACTENRKCHNCGGKHHVYICDTTKSVSGTAQVPSGDAVNGIAPIKDVKALVAATSTNQTEETLFMTGQLYVYGSAGKMKCRILIDSCSKLTYITRELSKAVHPRFLKRERLRISGFGGVVTEKKTRKLAFDVGGLHDELPLLILEAYETETICDPLPQIASGHWMKRMQEEGLPLADDMDDLVSPDWTGEVDLLIGASDAVKFLTGKMRRIDEYVLAVETIFGWVVMGGASGKLDHCAVTSALFAQARCSECDADESPITKLWELDAIGINLNETSKPDDDPVMTQFESSVKYEKGRYHVKLPWKLDHPLLPSNEDLAVNRLKILLRRLKGTPELLRQYDEHLRDHLHRDFAEEIPTNELNGRPGAVHYLPHRPIVRTDKVSTKIRSVFDASAGKPSLNNCLETGPNLLQPLLNILVRFRQHRVAFTADVEKAFLQIRLSKEDRDLVRFVWVDDPFSDEPQVKHFRWKSVVFGVTTSPFLLAATIRHHVKQFNQDGAKGILLNDMYMDDLISGADTVEAATKLIIEATAILQKASLPLRRWTTNDFSLREKITNEKGIVKSVEFSDAQSKVLGLVWLCDDDCLTYDPRPFLDYCANIRGHWTKRLVLAASSRLFDPLGLISPIIISPKILLQKIWRFGVGWDEKLPGDLMNEWEQWIGALPSLSQVKIPRFYFLGQNGKRKTELHLFSDASEKAYGCVAYLRSEDSVGNVQVTLVASKTRVAPVRLVTLPRLELLGCVLSAKLSSTIKEALTMNLPSYFWTDSQVALAWILRSPNSLKQFVANRIQTIHQFSSNDSWRFVPGKENPADLCSRGVSAMELADSNSIWWRGPDWLHRNESEWPSPSRLTVEPTDAKLEFKKTTILLAHVTPSRSVSMFNVENFSTISRLLRYTAYILRSFGNVTADHLDRPLLRREGELSAAELSLARAYWFRFVQQLAFNDDLLELRRTGKVPCSSTLSKLHPFLDPGDGLIKIRGRTNASLNLDYSPNTPILPGKLPKKKGKVHHFIALLIRDAHIRLLHAGVRDTLVELRQSCWIVNGRQVIKGVLKSCVPCNRIMRQPFQQPTAPLPTDRCSFSPPFEVTGLDFAGPFFLKDSGEKAWMCLFTCATTRAIHLELVRTMSAPCFLMALDRFFSRRGLCRVIYSDNARTFKRASKEIANRWKGIDPKLAREMGHRGIEWRFIVEGAPWWGGWWERMVGSVKILLKKVLGRASLRADELETLMIRGEAIINSRPITFVYDDHREPSPLCPAHFLLGRRVTTVLPTIEQPGTIPETELVDRYRRREQIMAAFERRWITEYLQERALHFHRRLSRQEIKLGEIVLIMDENAKRQFWRMGVIVELFPGRDNIVRAVRVRTANGDFRRPVQKLCSLEIHEELSTDNIEDQLEEDAAEEEANVVAEDEQEVGDTTAGPASSSRGEDVGKSMYKTRSGRAIRPSQRFAE